MMNDADRQLVERDSTLPGLRLLLDSNALLEILRNLAPLKEAVSVTLAYLRYKPGTSCAASLIVTLSSGESRHYFAKALPPHRFQQSWLHPKRQALIAAGDPNAPMALPDVSIILMHPAHDRTLRALSILLDDDKRRALFKELLPTTRNPESINWRFIRYKPERRAVIVLSLEEKRLAVLRFGGPKEYGCMLQGAAVGAALGHTPLITLRGADRMLVTGWIAGNSLDPEHNGVPAPTLMAAAGKVLAKIHSAPFSPSLVRTNAENIQALWRVMNTLTAIYPAAVERFQNITIRLAQSMTANRDEQTLIHGDFSADQLVQTHSDGTLRLIDWDRCSCGAPLVDLATFQARLELQAIGKLISREQAEASTAEFLSGYSAYRKVDSPSLKRYCAWALLCLVNEPFRSRATNWPVQVEALLARAEQLLEQADASLSTQADPMLNQLMCSTSIAEPLRQSLKLPSQSNLKECTLLRHKPGRRAIIQYQFLLPDSSPTLTVLGKYRNKGLNQHGFYCQQALWLQGFDDRSSVSVPEPLALMPAWNTWLQRKVAGDTLTNRLLPAEPLLSYWGQRIADALSSFQQHPGLLKQTVNKRWNVSDELTVLKQGIQKVAVLYPHWETRLIRLLAACEKLALLLASGKKYSVHRDFYPDQIMINRSSPQRFILLDFDLCCFSHAALDAGNYLAHVRELALRNYGDENALNQHELAFVHEYRRCTPEISAFEIQGFTTLSLSRHIFLSTQFRERAHTTSSLLDICEQALRPWLTI
ncbi:TPA: phosphotransferase family protein [Serratia marcescens]